ncbi:MAG: hypothetical protein R3175_05000 [Marinobacter sp.]|nr:hypothetical protein [Marinobacter sp.]MDX1755401.1 hypothetical protein [Marinobacter sp.]
MNNNGPDGRQRSTPMDPGHRMDRLEQRMNQMQLMMEQMLRHQERMQEAP